ncbi:MAG: hypothetical protein MUF45_09235 [Spirosomaceae bacterium]|jgi:hypothetical protein|nr:hypothetical protein [Spirosomataceae bacterium]
MKRLTAIITFALMIISLSDTFAQYDYNWAVGFRVGEPLGLNIRKYFRNGDRAFDVNLGTYGFLYGHQRKYNKGEYRQAGVMIQGIYLFHREVGRKGNFHVYYGFGGQINSRKHYKLLDIGVSNERKLSLGPTATAGFELKLPNQPNLAIFLDAGGYLEALPLPFFPNAQVSTGLRLNIDKL